MGEVTGIAWTDHTMNPWWGCTRVSPGCDRCYAEQLATVRRKLQVWGAQADRKAMSEAYWREPLKWNRKAQEAGVRRRVFCASMADVFEIVPEDNVAAAAVIEEARGRLWPLIEATPNLDWLLLTKRPQNARRIVPASWLDGFPRNVWLGTTAEDQARADQRIPKLLALPAAVRFVSYEPALGPVDFGPYLTRRGECLASVQYDAGGGTHAAWTRGLDWLIVGGESGHDARPFALEWAESVLRQVGGTTCRPFVKQLGRLVVSEHRTAPPGMFEKAEGLSSYALATNGEQWAWRAGLRDAKGGDPDEWPDNLRVREFPTPFVQGAP